MSESFLFITFATLFAVGLAGMLLCIAQDVESGSDPFPPPVPRRHIGDDDYCPECGRPFSGGPRR